MNVQCRLWVRHKYIQLKESSVQGYLTSGFDCSTFPLLVSTVGGQQQFKHASVLILSWEDEHSSRRISGTLIGQGRLLPLRVGERMVLHGSHAVCLRAGSHVEIPNGLIGVSGNGRYLTGVISQSWMKRLEAERERRGEGGYYAIAVC